MMNFETNVEFGKCSFKETVVESYEEDEFQPSLEDIQSGNVYCGEHYSDTKHIPFILASYSVDMQKIMYKMFDEWAIPTPRIIIIAVTETESSPCDQYRQHSHKLVKGLLHALNTTEMWLCTDGLNYGFSGDIGKAIENEICKRKTAERNIQHVTTVFPETALIGICKKENLNISNKLERKPTLEGENGSVTKRQIDMRYGYFIFIKDSTEKNKGEYNFLQNFANHIKTCENYAKIDESKLRLTKSETPIMILLLQGKITQIDLILTYIKLGLPLVVFEGSGGLADLIAYAYHHITFRTEGINEAEYTEAVLKPQISEMMYQMRPDFPDYKILFLTEKIFDCIRHSKKCNQEFITILNLTDVAISSTTLSSYLLKALFKSEPPDVAKGKLKRDLLLTMDWNTPVIAKEKIFDRDTEGKFKVNSNMFYTALTKTQREEFVSLFISQGFTIHSFLNSSNLLKLFRNSLNMEFFRGVIWENVLGYGASNEITRSFLDRQLIILLKEFTGIDRLVNSFELDWNSMGMYDDRTPEEAERKAVVVLSMWAILSYKVQLVKTIWRHCEQPIHLALACSIILKKLRTYVTDLNVKNEMKKQSKEFNEMACGVMTLCFESVPCRATDLLKEKNRVWSNKPLMELAAFAKNKQFLAHSSCQNYLDNIFMGYIKVKELRYGDITTPLWLKIVLSTFLIFPMFFWIRFEIPHETDKSSEDPESDNIFKEERDQSPSSSFRKPSQLFILKKFYYFWKAPITAFWLRMVFYVLFLILFSSAVIWPGCGNILLDFFSCVWLATMIIDVIYNTYIVHMKYSSISLVYRCFEISLMILFLFGYAMGRIIWQDTFMSPYSAKVMLCLALLYFYYRLIFVALPISSELGPMLYTVKRMTLVDFLNYMRITILVIISNGVVIHAVVYPDYPLGWELFRRAFFDAITAFFLMPVEAYIGTPGKNCIRLMRHPNKMSFIGLPPDVCQVGRYFRYDCPNPGVWPYLFGLQYMILLQLILVVLLFAVFSNTTRKLEEEGKYIWKYQRYELVTNFANRLILPPPFSILILIYLFIKYLFYYSCRGLNNYILHSSKLKKLLKKDEPIMQETLNENDFRYWKNLAMQYHKQEKVKREEVTRKRMEHNDAVISNFNEEVRELVNLESNLTALQMRLANAYQYLKYFGLQASDLERLSTSNIPQIFSRISPYPSTIVSRYPVSDNHIPWKINWASYKPISFTLPVEDYPPDLKPHVDVDIQRKREIEGDAFMMPNFYWNRITVSPAGFTYNRKSWITDISGKTFEYEIDPEGLPQNPYGRTGLKGRGSLPRWGPNHYIYVVITQKHEKERMFSHNYNDVILMAKNGKFSLLGGYIHTENRYEIIQSFFHTDKAWADSCDMISFLKSLTISRRKSIFARRNSETNFFTSEKIKFGYMDEEYNTDQAWCEAEIWHIHYNDQTNVKEKLKIEADWHMLTYEILEKVPAGQASIMYTVARKMKASLDII